MKLTSSWRAMVVSLLLVALADPTWAPAAETKHRPLSLHPQNSHYFLFRGRPTLLVASTEHYGAVMNLDFDYKPYLDELKAAGLNYTRIFSGVYCEPWGEPFNTLNPPKGRYVTPWARSAVPGYADGGNKFDLSQWDPAYFRRLRDFLMEAGERGVVVEITLFCNWYGDDMWRLSPLHRSNNINGVGNVGHGQVNTLHGGNVLAHQGAMLRKIVSAVNDLDNLFFEICNEPGASGDWMEHMANLIWETEGQLPNRHLIANNGHPVRHMSVLNATTTGIAASSVATISGTSPSATTRPVSTALPTCPTADRGWNFILNGGGLYDNLDWSFSVAHPDGRETKWDKRLGGGSPALRRQLGVLRAVVNGLDLVSLKPDKSFLQGGAPKGAAALMEEGRQYLIYLDGGNRAELKLALPGGTYKATWIDTKTGRVENQEQFRHPGGSKRLASPANVDDIVLRIISAGEKAGPRKR